MGVVSIIKLSFAPLDEVQPHRSRDEVRSSSVGTDELQFISFENG